MVVVHLLQCYPDHLDSDLYEQNNLINTPENKQKVSEMKAMLRSYVSDLPHAFGEFSNK